MCRTAAPGGGLASPWATKRALLPSTLRSTTPLNRDAGVIVLAISEQPSARRAIDQPTANRRGVCASQHPIVNPPAALNHAPSASCQPAAHPIPKASSCSVTRTRTHKQACPRTRIYLKLPSKSAAHTAFISNSAESDQSGTLPGNAAPSFDAIDGINSKALQ